MNPDNKYLYETIFKDLSIEDLAKCIEDEYASFKEDGMDHATNIFVENFTTEDWGSDQYKALIKFQSQKSIPPKSSIVLELATESQAHSILLSYQFRYDYEVLLDFPKDIYRDKFLKICASVFVLNYCTNMYRNFQYKKFSKIRYWRQLNHFENLFHQAEAANNEYEEDLEKWVESRMSAQQKREQKIAYDRYWGNIPEERRFHTITKFN